MLERRRFQIVPPGIQELSGKRITTLGGCTSAKPYLEVARESWFPLYPSRDVPVWRRY